MYPNWTIVLQYASIMGLIRELLDKVEEEHRAKLEQLNTIQTEQRSAHTNPLQYCSRAVNFVHD